MTLGRKIFDHLRPGVTATDRQLADALLGRNKHPSPINQNCRSLEAKGLILRERVPGGLILNSRLPGAAWPIAVAASVTPAHGLSEDATKRFLRTWLESHGWTARIAWGNTPGADVDARRDGARWIIEVKGCGSRDQMRVNYFIAMLGETLQRMNDPNARYSIAMPDMQQFRRLWDRLPSLAKTRTGISALFVGDDGAVLELRE